MDQQSVRSFPSDDLFRFLQPGFFIRNADKAEMISLFPDLLLGTAEDLEHMRIVKSRMLLGNGKKDDIIRPFPGKIAGLCIRQVVHLS